MIKLHDWFVSANKQLCHVTNIINMMVVFVLVPVVLVVVLMVVGGSWW
jgi:hypothetical protein